MALMYLPLAILVISNYEINGMSVSNFISHASTTAKSVLDPKRRNDLVEEAFLEQKDILLDMLESKLKDVQSKKRKKTEHGENGNTAVDTKCELLPNSVDVNLKASGIVGVGETDLKLKFGESGNNTLNLSATGISNVGKVNLNLDIGDGSINIPGLNNLFNGSSVLRGPCNSRAPSAPTFDKVNDSKNETNQNVDTIYPSRRSLDHQNILPSENVTNKLSTETVINDQNNNINEETTATISLSSDDQDATKTNDENKDTTSSIV